MVFLTTILLRNHSSPTRWWRRRKVVKLTGHFYGRMRNCYSLAIRALRHSMMDATKGRQLRKEDIKELRETRITAGCREHGLNYNTFMEALHRCHIFFDRKSLADLAVWEPRTFKALADIAKSKAEIEQLSLKKERHNISHFITRGLLGTKPS